MVKWRIERGVVQQTESLVRGFYEVKKTQSEICFLPLPPKIFFCSYTFPNTELQKTDKSIIRSVLTDIMGGGGNKERKGSH